MFEAPENVKLRHEWKHHITPADKAEIISRLSIIASDDPNYGNEPYYIRSLYFDNVYDKALSERLNGQEVREKFRIRFYNGDDSYIVLEKKSKFNNLCGKESTRITKEQALLLSEGQFDWLMETDKPLCHDLYAKMRYQLMRPRVLVDYTRKAFVYAPGNVRVTLDYDVRTGLSSTELFLHFDTIPADIRNPVIMEVKYDAYLPEIIRMAVQLPERHTSSFSKYTACRLTNY